MDRFLHLLKNKYVLVTVAFLVWLLAFDQNDLHSQYQYYSQVKDLEKQRDYLLKQTQQVNTDLQELKTNPAQLEKFAREKYLMKKDNEDIFVIVPKKDPQTP